MLLRKVLRLSSVVTGNIKTSALGSKWIEVGVPDGE
jgi:hypothetical protein